MSSAVLDQVKALLAALPQEDQMVLADYLNDLLVEPDEADERFVASLQETPRSGQGRVTYTYRQEWIKCGKAGCKCGAGDRHGPYVYKYWKQEGRLRKAYVGKSALPGAERPAAGGPATERPAVERPAAERRAAGRPAAASVATPPATEAAEP